MYYRELAPSEILEPFVRCLWYLDHDYAQSVHSRERLWASVDPELVIVVEGHYMLGDEARRAPSVFVMGPRTRARTLLAHGPVALVAARFAPWGLSTVLNVTPRELVDRVVPASDVMPAHTDDLRRLGSLTTHRGRADLLDRVLASAATRSPRPDRLVTEAVLLINRRGGQISVADLCKALTVDQRRLERHFATTIGLSPKRVARIAVFNQVRERLVVAGTDDLMRLACELGYADHAHLTRSFREHFGVTPSEFRRDVRELMPLMDADVGFLQA